MLVNNISYANTHKAETSASVKERGRNLRNSVGTLKVCDSHFVISQGVMVQKWRLLIDKSYLINTCTATLCIKIGLKT